MGTPRLKARTIARDSLPSLVPKEGKGKAPSHVSDSEEAQVRLCFAKTNRAEKWCS